MADDKIELIFDPVLNTITQKKFVKDAKNLGKKSGEATSEGFGKSFKKGIGKTQLILSNLISSAITSSIRMFSEAIKGGVQNLRDFSRGVAEINSILPKNAKLTREAQNAMIGFSSQFGTDAQSQTRAFYNIVSAGVKGTINQLSTLKIANTAATAGLVSIDDSAKLLVSSVNAYAKSGLTAAKASDALFVAVREGQTTFGELAAFMGNVTGLAGAAGLEFTELTGSIAAFTKTGLETNVAVTGLRQVLTSLVKPSSQAIVEAKRLGITFTNGALKAKGFAKFLKEIGDATKGSSVSLGKLFGNVRALTPIMTTLNGNFGEFKRILDATKNSAGATAEAFKIISSSLDFKMTKRGQEIKNFFLIAARTAKETFGVALLGLDKNFNQIALSAIETAQAINATFGRLVNIVWNIGAMLVAGLRQSGQFIVALFAAVVNTGAKLFIGLGQLILKVLEFSGVDVAPMQAKLQSIQDSISTFAQSSAEVFSDLSEESGEAFTTMFDADAVTATDEFFENLKRNVMETGATVTDADILGNLLGGSPDDDDSGGGDESSPESLSDRWGNAWKKMTGDSKAFANTYKVTAKDIAKASIDGIGKGAGAGFAAMGAALVNGENALEAFGKAFLASMGQAMVGLGTRFILEGIAWSLNPATPGIGGPLIGAGVALSVAGGALGAIGGGGAATGGGGGVGAATASSDEDNFDSIVSSEPEERSTQTGVSVNIAGDFLDSDEGGLKIVEAVNKAFETQGAVIRTNLA